jgi:sugar phosphate permease
VIGIASLSYGLGDVLVRVSIGLVLMAASNDKEILTPTGASFLWKKAFVFSIIMALLCMIPSYFKLVSPSQSIDSSEKKPKKVGFLDTLSYISTNPKFWVLLVVSPCLTLLRESLMVWLAVYLTDFLEIPESTAAILSMVFPLFGTFSTVVFGWIIDHLHPKRKGMIPTVALLGLSIILYSLSSSFFLKMESRTLSVFMECVSFSLAAFFLMGPYSYVEGVFALDLVSSKDGGVGIVLGIFNSVGYLGAILCNIFNSNISRTYSWFNGRTMWLAICIS